MKLSANISLVNGLRVDREQGKVAETLNLSFITGSERTSAASFDHSWAENVRKSTRRLATKC